MGPEDVTRLDGVGFLLSGRDLLIQLTEDRGPEGDRDCAWWQSASVAKEGDPRETAPQLDQ